MLAMFLFGNMAFVHAEGWKTWEITIEHTHGEIRETHIVETTDTSEPPHCSDSEITSSIIFQSRDIESDQFDAPDILTHYYSNYICDIGILDDARYAHYYPWPHNESFGHFLIGEQILLI